MPGGGPEHEAHHGYEPRQLGETLEVVGAPTDVPVGEAVAGPLEHEHERDALLRCKLAQPVPLVGRAGADRAAEHGEVLDARDRGPAVDATGAGDERVGGRGVLAGLFERAHERAELGERAGVEEAFDTGTSVELALRAVTLDALGPTHRARRVPALLEPGEDRLPVAPVATARHTGG